MWLELAKNNPEVEFWAYTKSLNFWVKRINDIPKNLILTASRGGRFDSMIDEYGLKNVTIIHEYDDTTAPLIDVKDRLARKPDLNFYLIENKQFKKFIADYDIDIGDQ